VGRSLIIFLWISKGEEFPLGMIVINLLVTGIKVVGITGIVLFLKKVLTKDSENSPILYRWEMNRFLYAF
jgi:hypothetical protein